MRQLRLMLWVDFELLDHFVQWDLHEEEEKMPQNLKKMIVAVSEIEVEVGIEAGIEIEIGLDM